jgi:2TM domain
MENLENDPLWRLAARRAGFKRNLVSYVIVNLFLIGVWYFTIGKTGGHFWPIWPILGWGLGVVMQYIGVYRSDSFFSVEEEYKKIKAGNK